MAGTAVGSRSAPFLVHFNIASLHETQAQQASGKQTNTLSGCTGFKASKAPCCCLQAAWSGCHRTDGVQTAISDINGHVASNKNLLDKREQSDWLARSLQSCQTFAKSIVVVHFQSFREKQ